MSDLTPWILIFVVVTVFTFLIAKVIANPPTIEITPEKSGDIEIRRIDGHEYIIYEDKMMGMGSGITHSASCPAQH